MPDIYLRQGAATPADVLLRDPTQADTGAVNASIAESQSAQTEAIVAAETFSAAIGESQAAQSESIVAAEKYSAAIAESQSAQTESIAASEKYSATLAESQASQAEAMTAAETYSAAISESQSAQSEAILGTVSSNITAAIVEAQAAQDEAVIGTVTVPIPVPPPFIGGGYGGLMPRFWTDKLIPELRKKKKPIPSEILEPEVLTPQRVASILARLPFVTGQKAEARPVHLDGLREILERAKNAPALTTIDMKPEAKAEELQKAKKIQEDQEILDLILTEVA